MICRRLDENHDYCFGRGFGDYLQDVSGNPEAIAQSIKTRLLLFLGEWWKDLRRSSSLAEDFGSKNQR